MSEKVFGRSDVDQSRLFPPSAKDSMPAGHLAHVARDRVRNAQAAVDAETEVIAACDRTARQNDRSTGSPGGANRGDSARGLRRRRIEKDAAEWTLLCTAPNLLKLAAANAPPRGDSS